MERRTVHRRSAGRPPATAVAQVNADLLRAAIEVFSEKGFSASSMAEISKRAGATRQTLYTRFPNKTCLFEALMESRTEALLTDIASLLNEADTVSEVLQRFGERLVEQFINSDMQRLHRVVIAEAATFPDLAVFFFQKGPNRGIELLKRYLLKQNELGNLAIGNVESAAEQFIGSLLGAVNIRATLLQPQRLDSPAKVSDWVQSAVRLFLSGYGISLR